jgi:tRNA pseudouridine55 synthase
MNGFLLLDKETGLNSFKLVVALRKLADQKRVGFAGTLDPLATGLMILALGEYTKLLPCLEVKDKKYEVKIEFGKTSDTYDAEGEIIEQTFEKGREFEVPNESTIKKLLKERFVGKIQQVPPRFSALKIDGQRAYEMARKGEEFEMKSREVELFSTEILEYEYPFLRLSIPCSKGTYIRSIAHDLGELLGCGGIVAELRRTAVGEVEIGSEKWKVSQVSDLDQENLQLCFVSPRVLLADKMQIDLNEEQYSVLNRGNFIEDEWGTEKQQRGEDFVALGFFQGDLVGVVERANVPGKLKFKKKLNIF